MKKASTDGTGHRASERLRDFMSRPEVIRIANKYEQKLRNPDPPPWQVELSLAGQLYAAGKYSRGDYRAAISRAAQKSGIPLSDMKIIASCLFELFVCALIGSGHGRELVNDREPK